MISKIKKLVLVLAIAAGLMLPAFSGTAYALFGGAKDEACAALGATDNQGHCDSGQGGALENSQDRLGGIVRSIIGLLTIVVGIMSVLMLVISGIRFVTSNGDSNKITSARNTLIYALVGLVIVAFAQAIVKLVLTNI